ncbi:hypothetical protein DFH94DRAFT_726614 [Russula ochroleuca]|uniref:MATH domain-containing protein n=1 Tax=Russula ochroleuca TaxID=152965 RepID=A0A9P5MZ42_9AGAM|nr:hypothetical protein DFH94DRAFT_726614 [Russula ochroleuca]
MEAVEFQESNSITFEWTLRGLKALFESSKGDAKSKVTKSTKFGGGRWQVLFYANSGPPYPSTDVSNASAGGYVSLFLSCEPTQEEKDAAYNGRWVREGLFRFTFELHSLKKKELFNIKEAHNHSFSHAFARRDAVYYSKSIVKANDAFDLLESVGQLLDDPLYSDIEFVLPSRSPCVPSPRRIYASKRLLSRADYFDSMFNAGFVEASTDQLTFEITGDSLDGVDATSEYTAIGAHPEDSDEEDEAYDPGEADGDPPNSDAEPEEVFEMPRDLPEPVSVESAELVDDDHSGEGQDGKSRNVRQKLAHPSSPRASIAQIIPRGPATVVEKEALGPPKLRVVVKDVAYSTYRAVLYYLYTDRIRFAPLSSSFLSSSSSGTSCEETPNDSQGSLGTVNRTGPSEVLAGASSRREWIQDYIRGNPGHPLPCSAKAVYRLADTRAFEVGFSHLHLTKPFLKHTQHITKSLTVENVPYEVFSTFSATFEVVRKVEVKYFLDHWTEIRSSDAMRKVWHQIRLGRHPGFEEVWPVIATHLEFKPQSSGLVGNDKEDSR